MKRQMEIYKFCESQVLSVSPFCQCIFLYLLFNIFSLFCTQSLLQDIGSHQRTVDSTVEKAQGVLQSTSNPGVADFIKDISSRYENLAQNAKVSD